MSIAAAATTASKNGTDYDAAACYTSPMRPALQEAFRQQARECRRLGSPFNGLVCELLSERLDGSARFGRIIEAWGGSPVEDALALRATGALHGLARSGRCRQLEAQYPPHSRGEPEPLWAAIAEASTTHDDFLCEYLDRPPQTNEVGRSSVLLGAALLIAQRTGLALSWHEIGASAGLNLAFDQYHYDLGPAHYGDVGAPVTIRSTWEGRLPPLAAPLHVIERAGADLDPLLASSASLRERLISYVWPDQPERLERTLAALAVAADAPWQVERAAAAEWVAARFSLPLKEQRVQVLAHTVVWQYLSQNERDAVSTSMNDAGRRATERARVAWISMEADDVRDGAGLHLTLWPEGERTLIGRADFHGRWVRWL